MKLLYSFQSEWLKRKNSAAAWLTLIGGFFIPAILLLAIVLHYRGFYHEVISPFFWEGLSSKCWQFMAILLLPLGVILTTSLITQIESRNGTWKQVHTTPQPLSTIFAAKLLVILAMMLQFFILFNIGIYLAGALPCLFFRGIPYPREAFPFIFLMKQSLGYFLDSLPIVALQYVLGLLFRNFMIPLGAGLGLFVGSLVALSWKYVYLVPYAYCALSFENRDSPVHFPLNIHLIAGIYFLIFITVGYLLYIRQKQKG